MHYFFASDVHLGLELKGSPAREREKLFVRWLSFVEGELLPEGGEKRGALFLLGDIFDFWFEYKRVVPKGFVRVLGKLAEMADKGIEIHFFRGNHDTWVYSYFEEELGIEVHGAPYETVLCGKRCLLAHGHGLKIPRSDYRYRLMHAVFNSPLAYNLYSVLVHPDLSMRFGHWWSHSSRTAKNIGHEFRGEEEPVVCYSREILARGEDFDFFIFGHLHTPLLYPLNDKAVLAVLGEWIEKPCYGVLSDEGFELKSYK
ncbi:MAG TPA: UDP-2,3-diacylglucosamine diphosphatase [Candidatus Avirikenella pullistercoris]|nr:UDP-2,3-diacylglucosamine diphosphatase [Candidatus Avirikenella pullistercoris]